MSDLIKMPKHVLAQALKQADKAATHIINDIRSAQERRDKCIKEIVQFQYEIEFLENLRDHASKHYRELLHLMEQNVTVEAHAPDRAECLSEKGTEFNRLSPEALSAIANAK